MSVLNTSDIQYYSIKSKRYLISFFFIELCVTSKQSIKFNYEYIIKSFVKRHAVKRDFRRYRYHVVLQTMTFFWVIPFLLGSRCKYCVYCGTDETQYGCYNELDPPIFVILKNTYLYNESYNYTSPIFYMILHILLFIFLFMKISGMCQYTGTELNG